MLDHQKIEKMVTRLSEADFQAGKVITVPWDGDLRYSWDDGVAIGRYLKELKNGKIIARKCESCHRVLVPPRMFCEVCWRPTDEWVYVQDTGTINTFVVSHVDWKAGRVPDGQRYFTPAVIELDGASKDICILHLIEEIEPYDLEIGMRVQAVWKPPEEREGSITDIRYFRPID